MYFLLVRLYCIYLYILYSIRCVLSFDLSTLIIDQYATLCIFAVCEVDHIQSGSENAEKLITAAAERRPKTAKDVDDLDDALLYGSSPQSHESSSDSLYGTFNGGPGL